MTDPLFRQKFTYQEAEILWCNPVQQSGRDAALEAEDDNKEDRMEEKLMFTETPHRPQRWGARYIEDGS